MSYYELKGEYFKRFKKRLLKINVGSDVTQNSYTSQFELSGTENITLEDFQNALDYNMFTVYVNASYSIDIGPINLSGKLETAYKNNYLKDQNLEIRDQTIVLYPEASFNWPINKKNKLLGSVTLGNSNPRVRNVIGNYALQDFNNFSRDDVSTLDQLQYLSVFSRYTLGTLISHFYANTTLIYQNNFEYYTSASQLTPEFVITDKFRAQGREFLKLKTDANFFLNFFDSNLKLKGGFTKQEYQNSVNSALRDIDVMSFDYGFEITSAFSGDINFHLGTQWS